MSRSQQLRSCLGAVEFLIFEFLVIGPTNNAVHGVCNGEQYVGETGNSIHTRANQHRSDITVGNKNIPTVRHFKRYDRENMKLTVIEKLRSTDQYTRRAKEEYWINKLKPAINSLT